MKQSVKFGAIGWIAGILNGIFGAGGGLLAVPMLEAVGLAPKKSHATSVAILLPLSAASAAVYLGRGVPMDWGRLLVLAGPGLLGAAVGALLLKRLGNRFLKKLFGVLMIVSAIRLFFR